ncbi:hypothetical protein ZHAS_00012832 [Anopheles sinensis]|uniref:Uncharacterized protein n=1 Tax=Anopheles sinensis TaxID=74873 RepID=A0A084W3T1_ANOSI|nr:hypothetical protein ZHAS_00012832 [Anopheles sinensis]
MSEDRKGKLRNIGSANDQEASTELLGAKGALSTRSDNELSPVWRWPGLSYAAGRKKEALGRNSRTISSRSQGTNLASHRLPTFRE